MVHIRSHRRKGVSELIGAVITIVITLIAGAALFGYVNSQASTSESNLGQANAANVNYLNERFVVADMSFSGNSVVLYLYNNGNVTLNLSEAILYNAAGNGGDGAGSPLYAVFTDAPTTATGSPTNCGTVQSPIVAAIPQISLAVGNTSKPITLAAPSVGSQPCLTSGTTYYVILVGVYGSKVLYSACDSPSGVCES
jgi:flagellin-like protein